LALFSLFIAGKVGRVFLAELTGVFADRAETAKGKKAFFGWPVQEG